MLSKPFQNVGLIIALGAMTACSPAPQEEAADESSQAQQRTLWLIWET